MVDACKMEMHIAIDPGTYAAFGSLSADLKLARNAIIGILLDKLVTGDSYMLNLIVQARTEKAIATTLRRLEPESIYNLIEMDNPLADR